MFFVIYLLYRNQIIIKTSNVMTAKEFLPVAQKLISTGLFTIIEKGEKRQHALGSSSLGRTDAQNTKLWRKYGTLSNIIIHNKTADEANEILKQHGITEFKAKATKSGTMCRLETV